MPDNWGLHYLERDSRRGLRKLALDMWSESFCKAKSSTFFGWIANILVIIKKYSYIVYNKSFYLCTTQQQQMIPYITQWRCNLLMTYRLATSLKWRAREKNFWWNRFRQKESYWKNAPPMFHSVVRHWTSVWKETRPFTNPFKESAKFFGGCFWLVRDVERRPFFVS